MDKSLIRVAFLLCFAWCSAQAEPRITGVSGAIDHGSRVVISGTEFGQKEPAKPYLWAPFDDSPNPSSLGRVTQWTTVENMTHAPGEGVGGSGALKASNGSGVWTAGVHTSEFAWNDYGRRMYVFRKVKRNFDVTEDLNWKNFRVWNSGHSYPNWYIQTGNGNLSVEGIGSGGYPFVESGGLAKARGKRNVWRTDEILTRANSSANKDDAEFEYFVDGSRVAYMPYTTYADRSLKLRDSSSGDMRLLFPVHGVKANTTFPSDYRYWVDDVYVDSTWARVMVGNAPTLRQSTHLEIQIPTSWSSTRIEVFANLRAFPRNQDAYLFVIDADGNASRGYRLSGAGDLGGAGDVAPVPPRDLEAR